jgi:tRNA nucleotidyltransferase/poly(A) polymerase
MGLIKNEHGVFHVRRKVPKAFEVATARALGVPKERGSRLKETLGTKDEKHAKVLAPPTRPRWWRETRAPFRLLRALHSAQL